MYFFCFFFAFVCVFVHSCVRAYMRVCVCVFWSIVIIEYLHPLLSILYIKPGSLILTQSSLSLDRQLALVLSYLRALCASVTELLSCLPRILGQYVTNDPLKGST